MATCASLCAVCDLRHQTSASTHWCIECEEPLCGDCRKHHVVLKATRNHKTIPFSDNQLLPTVVTDIKQSCVYHNEKYQLYCIKHESPICNRCVKDHGNCGEILSLDEITRDIKTSESFLDLEHSLDDLFDNIIQIRKGKESNIKSITDQKKEIAAEVCHLKKQVIQHVEKLEEEFIKELDQIELSSCDGFRSNVSSLQNRTKEIDQLRSEIQSTKKYASDLQAFLRMREIQTKTTEFENHLQSSIDNKNHYNTKIESTIHTKIQDILKVDRFGSIKIKKSPSTDINLNKRKDRQAQMMIPKLKVLIKDVKLLFKRELDTACKYPTGCCVTKKGEFLFTNYVDNDRKVVAINAEGEVGYSIPLTEPYRAFDVAAFADSTVAVSTGYSTERGVSIVDLAKRKVVKFIDLHANTFGISYDGKSLICCVNDKELHIISCKDYSITTVHTATLPWDSYVSTHADKICYTNPFQHKVVCCLYSGALVWEFEDESVLKSPRGITIDNNGYVFVVGNASCNVVIISPDGQQCKQILTREDGLNSPTTIFFDKVRNQLLVTNEKQFANVYNVSYV